MIIRSIINFFDFIKMSQNNNNQQNQGQEVKTSLTQNKNDAFVVETKGE